MIFIVQFYDHFDFSFVSISLEFLLTKVYVIYAIAKWASAIIVLIFRMDVG